MYVIAVAYVCIRKSAKSTKKNEDAKKNRRTINKSKPAKTQNKHVCMYVHTCMHISAQQRLK